MTIKHHDLASIDPDLLVVLDALLSESGVTRTAVQVGVTPSAMSDSLARLRELLSDALLGDALPGDALPTRNPGRHAPAGPGGRPGRCERSRRGRRATARRERRQLGAHRP